ncbi:hypothetical protein BS17DRAFT_763264 [Gyrodon lividus]|nr:hypothetical protein BS17DRAFT_763264 [Gyrodon lividus]
MWKGNIFIQNCNLQAAWFNGCNNVISFLSTSLLYPEEYDYDAIFAVEGVNMLCVFGRGKYPGVNQEDDSEDTSIISSKAPAVPVEVHTTQVQPKVPESKGNPINEEFHPTFEDQLENKMEDSNPGTSKMTLPLSNTSLPLPSGKGIHPADYLLYKGKMGTQGHCEISSPSSLESSFIVGNPFVTLLHCDNHTTTLALVHSTSIQENGVSHNDINLKTLQVNGSKVKVTGNVLTLLPCTHKPVEPEVRSKSAWVWNGAYLKTDYPIPGHEGMTTERVIEICMLGSLIEPVNPSVIEASEYLPIEKTAEINSRGVTWLLEDDILTTAINLI